MKTFDFVTGQIPLLVSMPHNGVEIPPEIAATMQPSAHKSVDTDWHLDKLYHFARDLGCFMLAPTMSRYVIDLNRSKNDESLYPGADVTGLCPINQFDYQPIYRDSMEPNSEEINRRVELYWQPYHDQLNHCLSMLKDKFGYALLFEAHSIKSVVPRFFDGKLADFNFGNFDNKSSSQELSELISSWQPIGYSKVFNERFKGGYITRHYGNPAQNIDSLQLELSQATYMDEQALDYDLSKAEVVIEQLRQLFESLTVFIREKVKSV